MNQNANKILSFFNTWEKILICYEIKMDRTKYKNVITNVLSTVETERVVDNIQNTKFSIFIGETSDICNDFSSSIPWSWH